MVGKRFEQTPLQGRYTNTEKYMERCSTPSVTKEVQIKTMKYHVTYIRITVNFFRKRKMNVDNDVEKLETLYIACRNVK
jgi:hypothetical protein